MSIFSQLHYLPYESSAQCMAALEGIEAIDYFFARQLFTAQQKSNPVITKPKDAVITNGSTTNTHGANDNEAHANAHNKMNQHQYQQMFHILLALSQAQRNGSVCLVLSTLADTTLGQAEKSAINISESTNESTFSDAFSDVQHIPDSSNEIIQTSEGSQGFVFSNIDDIQNSIMLFVESIEHDGYLVLENRLLYSKRYWQYEENLCRYIATALNADTHAQKTSDLFSQKKVLLATMKYLFSSPTVSDGKVDFQQLSVLNSLSLPFSIITGGAGTGKTYTITRLAILISVVMNVPVNAIEMAAPTGKAANRMAQSLYDELEELARIPELADVCEQLKNIQPKTINRLLKTNPTTGQSAYSAQRPLPAKLVIIDETSMIDISLMNKLINGLSPGTQLILVGDPNQLPSVETGCLLADLVGHSFGDMSTAQWSFLCSISPTLNGDNNFLEQHVVSNDQYVKSAVNRLYGMHRSHVQIDNFAKAILQGDAQLAMSLAQSSVENKMFAEGKSQTPLSIQNFVPKTDEADNIKRSIANMIAKQVLPNLHTLFNASSAQEAFVAIKEYALLTPYRQSYFGAASLNMVIEQELKLHYKWVRPTKLYKCKPIMILQNDYQLSLFNGDVGIIWENSEGELVAYFMVNKSLVAYKVYNLPAFDVNYAMTIHKTQGSEFGSVDIILPPNHTDFLNRQLLYTAVTRAQKHVRVFTSKHTFSQTVYTSANRISGIEERLTKALNEPQIIMQL